MSQMEKDLVEDNAKKDQEYDFAQYISDTEHFMIKHKINIIFKH